MHAEAFATPGNDSPLARARFQRTGQKWCGLRAQSAQSYHCATFGPVSDLPLCYGTIIRQAAGICKRKNGCRGYLISLNGQASQAPRAVQLDSC